MSIWNRTIPSAVTDSFFYLLFAISSATLYLPFASLHMKTASLMLKQLNFFRNLCFKTLPIAFYGSEDIVSARAPWHTCILTSSEIFSRIVRHKFLLQKPHQLFTTTVFPCSYSLYFIFLNSSSQSLTSVFLLYSSSNLSITLEKKYLVPCFPPCSTVVWKFVQ